MVYVYFTSYPGIPNSNLHDPRFLDEYEKIYIGRSSLKKDNSYEMSVHDWRSPIASVFYRFVTGPVPAPQQTPIWTYLLRPVLFAGAFVAMVGALLHRPHPVRWLLRSGRKRTRRAARRVSRTARLTAHRGAKQAKQWREIVLRPLRARR